MVMQSSLPSSTEATLFFLSDHGKVEDLCDWRPGTETWQMCSNCNKHLHGQCGNAEPVIEEKDNANTPSSLNFPGSYVQPSNVSTISESCMPNFVYRRRKLRRNSPTIFSPQAPVNMKKSADCHSVISSDAPSVAAKEKLVDFQGFQVDHESHTVGAPTKASLICVKDPCIFKSQSINVCSVENGHASDDVVKSGRQKILEVDSVNDSCSSSQSNLELVSASMATEVDDTGECSSSSVMAIEIKGEDLSENDLCIYILRCQGLVDILPTKNDDSTEDAGPSSGSSCSRLCNICGHSDTTMNMLICDHCEEAFHVSCLNPRMKKMPTDDDEWFCYSCLKKKCKIPKETDTIKSPSIASEMGRCRNTSVKGDSNPILLMLRDTEPYKMGVRVGKGFQAEVPDWSGPIINDVDTVGEPVEMNPSVCVTSHEWNVNKPYTQKSICNWLQCREVIDGIGEGVNGTICGKWRRPSARRFPQVHLRAPLCEVQTDDWDCFRSVLWDPSHADCAVPQELETDQVLKQLKYIQMLRPQLAAKRRKSDHTKSEGDPPKPTVNTSNMRTP